MCLRDASSSENARAIQDSESSSALEMKKMIKNLIKKGWTKNEIIYEMQRIYGNDILILPKMLNDERTLIGKNLGFIFTMGLAASLLAFRLRRGGAGLRMAA